MAGRREAFFQRVASSLIIPITLLPLAAVLLALGAKLQSGPLTAAGLSVVRYWLPLLYGIGISIGFTESDAYGALSVVVGYATMTAVAEAVAKDATLNVGVIGGLVVGLVCTALYNRVKRIELPEHLSLFSGKRLGPLAAAVPGIALGYLFGLAWPAIQWLIVSLGYWIYGAGAAGAFVYGAGLRLLLPTGLHHILMQVIDTQVGGWIEPTSGKLIAGEYLRFLSGDPQAGRLLSGFFLTLGFAPIGIGLAMIHEARPELRRRVIGVMTTSILTAVLLGITEPIEFTFLFASPILFAFHIVLSGFASLLAWTLQIRFGGYALPMLLVNWYRSENGLLLLPLGLTYVALYYYGFRALIRWLRPPILGQCAEARDEPAPAKPSTGYVEALGGAENIESLDACMTRLRLVLRRPQMLREDLLAELGVSRVLRLRGGAVQVVVGARAGDIAEQIRAAIRRASEEKVLIVYSPLTGVVVPLAQVPDPVFSQKMAGDGVAVQPSEGRLLAPVSGRVTHLAAGGHAVSIRTSDDIDVLVHIGIDTVALTGEGFSMQVTEGEAVAAGAEIGRFDMGVIAARGKATITPVLIINAERLAQLVVLAAQQVEAGEPLLRAEIR